MWTSEQRDRADAFDRLSVIAAHDRCFLQQHGVQFIQQLCFLSQKPAEVLLHFVARDAHCLFGRTQLLFEPQYAVSDALRIDTVGAGRKRLLNGGHPAHIDVRRLGHGL